MAAVQTRPAEGPARRGRVGGERGSARPGSRRRADPHRYLPPVHGTLRDTCHGSRRSSRPRRRRPGGTGEGLHLHARTRPSRDRPLRRPGAPATQEGRGFLRGDLLAAGVRGDRRSPHRGQGGVRSPGAGRAQRLGAGRTPHPPFPDAVLPGVRHAELRHRGEPLYGSPPDRGVTHRGLDAQQESDEVSHGGFLGRQSPRLAADLGTGPGRRNPEWPQPGGDRSGADRAGGHGDRASPAAPRHRRCPGAGLDARHGRRGFARPDLSRAVHSGFRRAARADRALRSRTGCADHVAADRRHLPRRAPHRPRGSHRHLDGARHRTP